MAIEVTTDTVEGVSFIRDVRLVPPFERMNGITVELVRASLLLHPQVREALKAVGLKEVGYAEHQGAVIYAHSTPSFLLYHIVYCFNKSHWAIVKWLYNNARMFQQIPEGEAFSWRYFTPFCWYRRARGLWANRPSEQQAQRHQ